MIKCAECGKEFSDRANACPNCGCPIEYQAEKSIGVEYHAADKLAPSVIVEHLTIAKELESERYTLLCAVDKLQAKMNKLCNKRTVAKPDLNAGHKMFIAFVVAAIVGSIGGFIIAYIFNSLKGSRYIISDSVVFACLTAIVSGIVSPIITRHVVKKNEKQRYLYLLHGEESRIAYEKEELDELIQQRSYLQSKVSQISNTLDSLYSLDIIHPKYRNMVAVIRILEYFDSGRCTALTGTGGAYNKYEKEIRQDAIISKLDTAINCLYQIRDTQYMLYESLEDCLDELGAITTQNDKLISTNQDISQNSAIAAYNSKIAASNTDALVFIEAYKGANGL